MKHSKQYKRTTSFIQLISDLCSLLYLPKYYNSVCFKTCGSSLHGVKGPTVCRYR